MNAEQQAKIDQINEWVRQYKEDSNMEAGDLLVKQFEPFLIKQGGKLNRMYPTVHLWSDIMHEANVMFCQLLTEYTIGGEAYFNVFIMRKLPLRLRYFFIKEIKRRSRWLSHSEEQFIDNNLIGVSNNIDSLLDDWSDREDLQEIFDVFKSDILNDREIDMIIRNKMYNESHETIAEAYGISRSRVSRIVSNAIDKVRFEIIRGAY